jgi:hypothetical protein
VRFALGQHFTRDRGKGVEADQCLAVFDDRACPFAALFYREATEMFREPGTPDHIQ